MAETTEKKVAQSRIQAIQLLMRIQKGDSAGVILEEIDNLLEAIKAIPRGEPGAPGVGEPGKNFVPTKADLKKIADMVTVPVVEKIIEKRETFREIPLITRVTEVVKEVKEIQIQVPNTISAQELLDKLASVGIPYSLLKDVPPPVTVTRELPAISLFGGRPSGGAKSFIIRNGTINLGQDIRIINFTGSGLTATRSGEGIVTVDVSSGGSGSFNVETPSGIIDGSNTVFTVLNTPKAIVIDNLTYFGGGDGYTYSGGTITTNPERPPALSIKSLY